MSNRLCTIIGWCAYGMWWGVIAFVVILFITASCTHIQEAQADPIMSEWDRVRIAREIADQQLLDSATARASGARPKHEVIYYRDAKSAPSVSREEIEAECGFAPSDMCIRQVFNHKFEATSKGFRE